MQPTDFIDKASLRDDIPEFGPGDTLKVHARVVEGNKERIQVFEGVVIRRRGKGLHETCQLRCRRRAHLPRTHPDRREDRAHHQG